MSKHKHNCKDRTSFFSVHLSQTTTLIFLKWSLLLVVLASTLFPRTSYILEWFLFLLLHIVHGPTVSPMCNCSFDCTSLVHCLRCGEWCGHCTGPLQLTKSLWNVDVKWFAVSLLVVSGTPSKIMEAYLPENPNKLRLCCLGGTKYKIICNATPGISWKWCYNGLWVRILLWPCVGILAVHNFMPGTLENTSMSCISSHIAVWGLLNTV